MQCSSCCLELHLQKWGSRGIGYACLNTPCHSAALFFRCDWTQPTCTCQVWKLRPPRHSHRPPEGSTTRATRSTSCACAATGNCSWHPPKDCALQTTTVVCVGDETWWRSYSILRSAVLQLVVPCEPFPTHRYGIIARPFRAQCVCPNL